MSNLRLIVFGLVVLIGLAPTDGGGAAGYSSAHVTPSAIQPAQLEDAVSLPNGTSANWWATAQEDIGRSEYQVTRQDRTFLTGLSAAYQAPNRAHNLRAYFTPTGIRIIPRAVDSAAWEWGLTLTDYGCEGAVQPVPPAGLSAQGNRIEYRRGNLTEWYLNDDRGIEQGFTIAAPPVSTSRGEGAGYLVLEMALTGDLTPSLAEDGLAVELTTEDGMPVLRYGNLYVEDATGRRLPAHLAVRSSGISVLVDDSSAIYPIIVDPLLTSPGWTAEGNQAGAWFGWSVGTAGDVNGDGYADVIVGARGYDSWESGEGRAFVYHGSATGLSAAAGWTAEGDQGDAQFG